MFAFSCSLRTGFVLNTLLIYNTAMNTEKLATYKSAGQENGSIFNPQAESVKLTEKIYPWSNRTQKDWITHASSEEAARIFSLLAKQDPSKFPLNEDWITLHGLNAPFIALFGESQEDLGLQMARIKIDSGDDFNNRSENGIERINELFSDDTFPNYLLERRWLVRSKDNRSINYAQINQEAEHTLNFTPQQSRDMQRRYEDLIQIFLPVAQEFARQKHRKKGGDLDDWKSLAALKLIERIDSFYWETAVIDPNWTANRFCASLYVAIRDPQELKFDTHRLESSLDSVDWDIAGISNTEDIALAEIRNTELSDAFNNLLQTSAERRFLTLRIKGYSIRKIALEMGTPEITLTQEMRSLMGKLEALLLEDSHTRRKTGEQNEIWDKLQQEDFFVDYKRRFDLKKGQLPRFKAEIGNLFFELYDGDRDATITAVWKEGFSHCKRETIQRQITYVLNALGHREPINIAAHRGNEAFRQQERRAFVQVMKGEEWSSLSPIQQEIITLYCDGKNLAEIANDLGIDRSTVSRHLDKSQIALRRVVSWR